VLALKSITSWHLHVHLHAGPEGQRGPVVPGVDNTAPHMFAFRSGLIGVGCLLDVDGKLLVGPGKARVSIVATVTGNRITDLVCSKPRTAAILKDVLLLPLLHLKEDGYKLAPDVDGLGSSLVGYVKSNNQNNWSPSLMMQRR
jgi:hypothetical protein